MKNVDVLVSIIVTSYNSDKTIIDTLNSIFQQSYRRLELIITDDCSKDDTIKIASEWINKNKNRFERTEIVKTEVNSGIPANLNRGINKAHGEWIKCIAGDDMLIDTCIEDNINYVISYSNINVLFSLVQGFNEKGIINCSESIDEESLLFYQMSAKDQYDYLLKHPTPKNLAPSVFFRSEIIKSHPYNELVPFQEDYPKWIDFTKNGIKLFLMDKVTVLYRYSDSLSNSYVRFYNPRFMESQILYFYLNRKKKLEERGYIDIIEDEELKFFIYFYSKIVLRNRRNFLTRILRRMFALTIKAIKE